MHKQILAFGITAALTAASSGSFAASPEMTEPSEIYSYIVGYQVAARVLQKLEKDGVSPSEPAFRAGLEDRLSGDEPRFTQDQVIAAIKTLQSEQKAQASAASEANLAAEKAFLEENAKKENVKVMESGLQYVESKAGEGQQPTAESLVMVHYRGTLINGEEFDSSYARGAPAKFAAGGVIPGFREALLNMREGSKWRVFIPSALGYGAQGAGGKIGPHQALIFDLELIEIVSE